MRERMISVFYYTLILLMISVYVGGFVFAVEHLNGEEFSFKSLLFSLALTYGAIGLAELGNRYGIGIHHHHHGHSHHHHDSHHCDGRVDRKTNTPGHKH